MTASLDRIDLPADDRPGGHLDPDFDLDITVIEDGSTVDNLLRLTDDNCGTTCQSACNSC